MEILLRGNRRLLWLSLLTAAAPAVAGATLVWRAGDFVLAWWLGRLLILSAIVWIVASCWIAGRRRLGYADGCLLVYLSSGRPTRVPIDVVEVFFLGQGSVVDQGQEPAAPRGAKVAAANVVVRLAEAATEWREGAVNSTLGAWRDGYITVRGLWCEPLGAEVIQRLNRRLVEIKRCRRQSTGESNS